MKWCAGLDITILTVLSWTDWNNKIELGYEIYLFIYF